MPNLLNTHSDGFATSTITSRARNLKESLGRLGPRRLDFYVEHTGTVMWYGLYKDFVAIGFNLQVLVLPWVLDYLTNLLRYTIFFVNLESCYRTLKRGNLNIILSDKLL